MTESDVQWGTIPHDGLLQVEQLSKSYGGLGQAGYRAEVLKGISFTVGENETVGLVGASGAGKSTAGRIIAGLEQQNGGRLLYMGHELSAMKPKERKLAARSIQMIFQDPYESLSPRMTVEELVAEPLLIQKLYPKNPKRIKELVREALSEVSLYPDKYMSRYSHELSGGERQRVGLARAFITRPRLIVADEPTSMLDSSLRLDLVNLMNELRRRHHISYLFITHDIALTAGFCDRLLVLDRGEIVEAGRSQDVIARPQHPFTKQLIGALRELHDSH